MEPELQVLPIMVENIEGSAASDAGESLRVGMTLVGGGRIDAILPIEKAMDLVLLMVAALGEARRRKTGDNTANYIYRVSSWEIRPHVDDAHLTFALRLPGGLEAGFLFDRGGAFGFLEGISTVLGLSEPLVAAESSRH